MRLTIQAGMDAIRLTSAQSFILSDNHLSGTIGMVILQGSQNQVRSNAIQGFDWGVLLGQETWGNVVKVNTILGVAGAGIALEPGVVENRVLANRVLCALETECVTVDTVREVVEVNAISRNWP